MRGWGLPWLVLGLAGAATSPGTEPPLRLQAEVPVVRTLASGEVHLYQLTLEQGDYLRLEVVQQGLDVETVVRGPSGSEIVKVDSPTGRFSTENVSLVAEQPGEYEVEVQTHYPGESGRYELILAPLREAGPDDRLRVEAERTDLLATRDLEAARRALKSWQTLGDRLHEGRALIRLGKVLDNSGQRQDALAYFEQAISLQRGLNDREGLAEALGESGKIRRALGDHTGALKDQQEALALWLELGRPDLAANTVYRIGQAHESSGDTDLALAAYERVLALSRQAGDRGLESQVLNTLGKMHISLGQPLQALDELRRALDLARLTGRRNYEGQALTNLGVQYRNLGMPHEALEHFAAARKIARERNDRSSEAAALHNLGVLLFQLGALGEAREMLLQALLLAREPREQASTLIALSWVAEALGEPREAAARLDESLKLQKAAGDRAGEAETLRAHGLVSLDLGETDKAGEMLHESLRLFEEAGNPRGAAAARRGLARVQEARGQLEEARAAYEEARKQAEALGDVGAEALTLAEQGRLEHEHGSLPVARARLEAALERLESFRSEVGSDQLRALHFATMRETYERYVDVLMQLREADPEAGPRAFEIAEQSRARGLLDVLSRARIDTREGDPKQLAEELRLRQELNAKAELRLKLPDDEASRPRREALQKEIERLTTEHQLAEALVTGGSLGNLKKPSVPLADIQALLDEQTVLLEYMLAEPRSYLWVVGPTSLQAFELPGRKQIAQHARNAHELLRSTGERDLSVQRKALRLLADEVLGRAAGAIAGRRLLIVADGALQYIPFGALPGTAEPFLVKEHEIVVLPSAAVLLEIRRATAGRPPRPASLAIVADPVYDGTESEPRRVMDESTARGSGLKPLFSTRQEAEAIAAVARERAIPQVKVALGTDANRELVTSGQLGAFRALHFATHGILDAEHPQLSGLALSQRDAAGKPVDGFLTLQDLYSLRLQADLVVLSACDTGLGRELRGEGLVGLTQGFFHAGASQVVASLWPVRDQASAELMQSFYRSMLGQGLHPAAALRAAQIEMIDKRTWRDPYFWAAFVAQGDWTAGL
jgi:CHAT domain-containing protein/Tfp pilus assembly protein PilF